MKIIELIQEKFTSFGYLSAHRDSGCNIYDIIAPIFILITLTMMGSLAAVYSVRHFLMGDIENSLYAGLDVPATLLLIGTYSTVLYNKKKLQNVIDEFQEIFDKCKNRISHENTVLMMICVKSNLQAKMNRRLFSLYVPIRLFRKF